MPKGQRKIQYRVQLHFGIANLAWRLMEVNFRPLGEAHQTYTTYLTRLLRAWLVRARASLLLEP